jgi:hypothetical protein
MSAARTSRIGVRDWRDPGDLLLDSTAVQDPYPVYDHLREAAPVLWSDALGTWIVLSYDHARTVYREHERFSNEGSQRTGWDVLPAAVQDELPTVRFVENYPALPTADPPLHGKHRRAVSRPLAPRRIAAMEEWVSGLCSAQLEVLTSAPSPDLIRDYSAPLAFQVILGLFDVPMSYAALFTAAGMARSRFHSYGCNEDEVAYAYEASLVTLRDALEGVLADTPPGDATLIAQMSALKAQQEFSSEEIFQILRTFFTAAHENLVYGLPVTMLYLLRDPAQRALVLGDPALAADAYDEGVRIEPHTQGNRRRAVDDCELGGATLRKGDPVLALKAAANRDPQAWTDPNRFDLTRNQNEPDGGSITFGQGVHFCVGAGVARLTGPTAIRHLLAAFPAMSLPPEWRPAFEPIPGLRKLSGMPVTLA